MIKTALITGGAQRVGKSICIGLAKAGYAVAVHYNNSLDSAAKLVSDIETAGGKAIALGADLQSAQDTGTLIQRAAKELGPIGLLINNASVFEEDSPANLDPDLWNRHFDIHVRAPVTLAGEFAKQGLDEGLIVNIIDERVHKLTPNFTSYTLSKSALWTATQTLAQALAPAIRVNAIGPGPTLPSIRQSQQDFDNQVSTLLLQRAPALDEFVDTILYFARAKSVTGQMIALDGGQHLGWQTPDQRMPE